VVAVAEERPGDHQSQRQRRRRRRPAPALARLAAASWASAALLPWGLLLGVAAARLAAAAVASGEPELPAAVAAVLRQTETGIVLLNG